MLWIITNIKIFGRSQTVLKMPNFCFTCFKVRSPVTTKFFKQSQPNAVRVAATMAFSMCKAKGVKRQHIHPALIFPTNSLTYGATAPDEIIRRGHFNGSCTLRGSLAKVDIRESRLTNQINLRVLHALSYLRIIII